MKLTNSLAMMVIGVTWLMVSLGARVVKDPSKISGGLCPGRRPGGLRRPSGVSIEWAIGHVFDVDEQIADFAEGERFAVAGIAYQHRVDIGVDGVTAVDQPNAATDRRGDEDVSAPDIKEFRHLGAFGQPRCSHGGYSPLLRQAEKVIDGEEAVNVVLLVVFKLLADLGCRQAAHELQDRVHAHRVLGAEWF